MSIGLAILLGIIALLLLRAMVVSTILLRRESVFGTGSKTGYKSKNAEAGIVTSLVVWCIITAILIFEPFYWIYQKIRGRDFIQ